MRGGTRTAPRHIVVRPRVHTEVGSSSVRLPRLAFIDSRGAPRECLRSAQLPLRRNRVGCE